MKTKYFSLLALSLVFSGMLSLKAQSLSSITDALKAGAKTSVSASTSSLSLPGTWVFQGSAVELESGNILKKVGGNVLNSQAEKNIDAQLGKVGIKAGITTFTFATDSTFTCTAKEKKVTGNYVYDSSNKQLTLSYLDKASIIAKVSQSSSSKISLLFKADEFLSLINTLSSVSESGSLKTINSILNSYDGVMVGWELQKR